MDNIINKDIQVENIEAKMASTGNMKYVITDTNRNKYYFYQKNKGQDCDVFQSFTGMGLKIGDSCHIGFTEEAKSFVNNKNETINYTDRFILGLREANGSIPTFTGKKINSEPNLAPQSKGNDDFGKRLAVHGFVNALINSGTKPEEITGETIVELVKLEGRIDAILNPSAFRQSVQAHAPQIVEPELPVIQQEEVSPDIQEIADEMKDISVEDIPF